MEIRGQSWDPSVYAGLRKFHQAKDFDPESQDVARHLGHPLYQLSGERNTLFAYSGLTFSKLVPYCMLKNEQLMASILAMKMSRTEIPGRRNQTIHLDQSS
jgi:hypothetical protein